MASLPDMALQVPFYRPPPSAQAAPALQDSRPSTVGILKTSSLPVLGRPSSTMRSGGLPFGAANFQNLPDGSGLRPGMLPSMNESMSSFQFPSRPGTSQCTNWLESSMGFRAGKAPPPSRGMFSFSDFRPKTVAAMDAPSVSWTLQQWPAKTAARARMGSLSHFTATPPRPISRGRPPLPFVTLMGVHGGQTFHAEDWDYKRFGAKLDKRMRHDHIAGDLGRS